MTTFDWWEKSAILNEDRVVVDIHVQFQLLFEQFHILTSIHSGERRNKIQTSSTTARHGGCFVRATTYFLTKRLPNMLVARHKLLYGAFVRKQHFLSLSERQMAMTFGKFQALVLQHWCHYGFCVGLHSKVFAETSRNSFGTSCCTFKGNICRMFPQ